MTPAESRDAVGLMQSVFFSLAELRWADAEDAARAFVSAHPESADGRFALGEVCRELWRLDEARTAFERAIALDVDHAAARAGLAFIHIVSGRFDDGIAQCRWANHLRSDLAAPHRYLASALMLQGQAGPAAEHALQARRLAPLQPENSIVLSAAWARSGLFSGASRLIELTLARDPRRAEAWVTRAGFRFAKGDAPGARADLDEGLARKPWLPPAHALLARLDAAAGRIDRAFEAIARARAGNPGSEEYLLLEAAWLAANGRREEAIANVRREWWRHPKSRALKSRLAIWLLEEGRVDEARLSVSGLPANAGASALWRRLGGIWMELGAEYTTEAVGCYRRALDEDGDSQLRLALADALQRIGRLDAALATLDGLESAMAESLAADCLVAVGRPDQAFNRLRRAADAYPADAFIAVRLGMAWHRRRSRDDAERLLERARELAPDDPGIHEQMAFFLADTERIDEALKSFRRAMELSANASGVRLNAAITLGRARKWDEAEVGFRQIIAAEPGHIGAMTRLAQVLNEKKRWVEAIDLLDEVVERVPDDAISRGLLVHAYRSLHRVDSAVNAARRWVDDAPNSFEAVAALARQLAAVKDPTTNAVADRAWALAPDTVPAMDMRADVANQLGLKEESMAWIERGLAIEPAHIGLLNYRALLQQEIGSAADAADTLRRVLALAPDVGIIPMNLALLCLREGAFEEGWRRYETRDSAIIGPRTLMHARIEHGGPIDLANASVLVRTEQGLGDTLQFMRYVTRLAGEARDVSLHMPDQITWLARGLAPNLRIFGYQEFIPLTDYQTALLSLPAYYGTDLASVPADVPYITADLTKAAAWGARLGTDGFKIGIVWHTDPGHGNPARWIPLASLAPLAEIPGVRLISLQKFHGLDQVAALPASQPIEVLGDDFDSGPDAFSDAAAVVANLDLVISIDTSMAHLAGAMARPTWVLLPRASDWRWLRDRDDSPWYPTVRLLRQRVSGDWSDVARMALERCRAAANGAPAIWPIEK